MKKKRWSRTDQVKRLEETLKEEREKSNEYLNRLKHLQADFENYRKRMEKEIRERALMSNEEFIVNLRDEGYSVILPTPYHFTPLEILMHEMRRTS